MYSTFVAKAFKKVAHLVACPLPPLAQICLCGSNLSAAHRHVYATHFSFNWFGAIVGHLQQVEVRLALRKNSFAPPLSSVKKFARHGYIAVVHGKIWFYGYVVRLCMPLCGGCLSPLRGCIPKWGGRHASPSTCVSGSEKRKCLPDIQFGLSAQHTK